MKARLNPSLSRSRSRRIASALLVLSQWTAASWACDPDNVKHVPCPASSQTHQPLAYTAAKKPAIGPVSPEPLHGTVGTAAISDRQSIIFVGGKPSSSKSALNPQPIPPGHGNGKAALNPQPIPPRNVLPASPPKWDVTKNKGS
jgi:hypothetical protein